MSDSAPSNTPIRIVIADDHAMVREGLRLLIELQPDIAVVGEAADGAAAVRLATELRPDVVVMDISMPQVSGTEATRSIRASSGDVKVLGLTVHEERTYVEQMLRAGASGCVLKRAVAAELVRAIRLVCGGDLYVDPSVDVAAIGSRGAVDESSGKMLSPRERQALIRMAQGFSNKEIAAELGISPKTVETYKARIEEKLGLTSRVAIVQYAVREGWLADASVS